MKFAHMTRGGSGDTDDWQQAATWWENDHRRGTLYVSIEQIAHACAEVKRGFAETVDNQNAAPDDRKQALELCDLYFDLLRQELFQ